MNHIFRLVWSQVLQSWVAVAETTRGRGKGGRRKLVAAALALTAVGAQAGPEGGQVVSGSAGIQQAGATTTINQASQNLSLNWRSFNVGAAETVNFVQPSASAVAVNRIADRNGSQIFGHLNANGQVYLINPNGILFGRGAQVNVGGLVASTLDVSDANLSGAVRSFSGNGTGSVVNQGALTATNGGYIALLGNQVSNHGSISAPQGAVALGAGSAATLTFQNTSLVSLQVERSVLNSQADNGGLIQANGGLVMMTAGAKDALLASVVNNTGVIEARTVEHRNGSIVLLGGMAAGSVQVGGTLDASAPQGGNGGFIETSAAHVQVADSAKITTAATLGMAGTWLIDPVDFTIAASGGNMTGASLMSGLGAGNVTILSSSGNSGTAGNVNVNDVVSWSANKLTLNAQNNININAGLNGSGSASLALLFGQGAVAAGNTNVVNVRAPVNLPAGNHFSTTQGSNGTAVNFVVLNGLGAEGSVSGADLQGMNGNLALNYALGGDIDASATSGWNAGAGFAPVGDSTTAFSGAFAGLGHTITNLTINRPNSGNSGLGLFGQIASTGTVTDIGLIGGGVNGPNSNYVGVLAGVNNGKVTNAYATGTATGSSVVGGLMGINYGTVNNSHATGTVLATGDNAGGLSAYNFGVINNSYASGAVSAGNYFSGGLIGTNMATVSNSYATGAVTGNHIAGGLVAFNQFGSNISTSYATGTVTGTSQFGALVGANNSTIASSYWNSTVSGATGVGSGSATGATGLTSLQMQTAANFAGFTFTTTPGATGNNWVMVDNDGRLNNAGAVAGATRPMLAAEYSSTITNAHQLQLMSMNLAGNYFLGQNISASATGTASDVWSNSSFIPVGDNNSLFTGSFNGLGHVINGLVINLPTTSYVGLFGGNGGVIRNLGLTGGSVTGSGYVGGITGNNANSSALISNSYNTGSVTGSSYLGGLVGQNWSGSVSNSYATGDITSLTGGSNVGGLVGYGHNSASVNNSYATGAVVGGQGVGGLMGSMNKNSVINNSYSTGHVTGTSYVGGLIGVTSSGAGVNNSFWNTQTSQQATSGGGAGATGLTSAAMLQKSSFGSLDFTNTWVGYDGHTIPLLRSFMTALTVTANNAVKTYDGVAYAGGNGVTYSLTPNSNLLGTVGYGGTAQGAINAGSDVITASGLYSGQQGYLINYVDGALTVNKAGLTVGSGVVSKTYDGTLSAAGTVTLLGGTLYGSDHLSGGSFAFTDKNAGSGNKVVATSGVTVSDSNGGGNYLITYANNTASTIDRANLSISGVTALDKNYDASTVALLAGTAQVTALGQDVVNVAGVGSGAFADSSVGAGKAVTVSGFTLGGADAGNYNALQPTGLTAAIIAVAVPPPVAPVVPVEPVAPVVPVAPVAPAPIPAAIFEVRSQLAALASPVAANVQAAPMTLPPVVAPVAPPARSDAGETASSGPAARSGPDVTLRIGVSGPSLNIVNEGVRLPTDRLNNND
ncbi:two-partner secretion domain-containing protein [Actimicrobium sp. GrIS 1.19]|uniref:two-partner secretion domain-containing protein n=1 Tax=Actimicrobium sp. GrIS 1.19 TaxID=3071708 RepID=UPI002E0D7AEE